MVRKSYSMHRAEVKEFCGYIEFNKQLYYNESSGKWHSQEAKDHYVSLNQLINSLLIVLNLI